MEEFSCPVWSLSVKTLDWDPEGGGDPVVRTTPLGSTKNEEGSGGGQGSS